MSLVKAVDATSGRGPLKPGVPPDLRLPLEGRAATNIELSGLLLMASRLLYRMSKQGVLPRFLQKVHPARRTP